MNMDEEKKHNDDEQSSQDEISSYEEEKYQAEESQDENSNREVEANQASEELAATTPKNENKKKNRRGFNFISMIIAAIIGSVITLAVVAQTDLLQVDKQDVEEQVEDVVTEESGSGTDPKPVSSDEMNISDIIEKSSEAIVGVTNYGEQQVNPFQPTEEGEMEQGTGSGVIYDVTDDAAYIVTNHHVIDGANKVSVSLHDGETEEAKLVGTDPLTDTAVLKIAGEFDIKPLEFGDSDDVRSGESVIAIGNPLGLELSRTVTQGIISAVDRSINVETAAGDWDLDVIQTDAAINPGNSGGALINANGELIGINSLKIASNNVEGLGFAIPSNDVKTIVKELRENGQVERAYLGVGLEDLRTIPPFYMPDIPDDIKEGALVMSVDENSAAGKAGLKEEDIIVKMGDTEIKSDKDVRKVLYKEAEIGDDITLTIYRDGKKEKVDVTLTSNIADEVS